MNSHELLKNLRFLFRVYLIALAVFFIYRVAYLFRIMPLEEIKNFTRDIGIAFLTSLRFDTATICYGLVPAILMSFLCLKGEPAAKRIVFFQRIYLTVLFAVFCLVLVVDYYYYTYFQSHINVQIFGFVEDDTAAVLKSLWTDYPLLKVLVGLGLCVSLFFWLLKKTAQHMARLAYPGAPAKSWLYSFLLLVLFVAGLRSSFGTFPVQMDDASVSSNAKVNLLPINGVFALKDAIVYHRNEFRMDQVLRGLAELGYGDRSKAMNEYLTTNEIRPIPGIDSLYAVTPANARVRQTPPHVVFFLLESWSNNNLYLHGKDVNLLGKLENYWNNDILFRNFLSGHNGTINSIEGMMINTPVTPVAQSEYSDVTFESSCAKPFKEKGYRTLFISGGKISWRNINNFIPRQYFDDVEGNADIMKADPKAHECEWGVYDEYVFDDVFRKLEKADRPQFIFALTTTNHTPFHLPDHYNPYPVHLSNEIKGKLKVDEELAVKNLVNLQYTNDCLGRFLDQLSQSSLAENTIVVATGDHNNLMLFDFDDAHAFYRYSVPLLLHVPEKYLQSATVDTSRWGSHKDIFPTIYHLALDSVAYFNNGNDLLEQTPDKRKFFAINLMGDIALNDDGAVRYKFDERYYSRQGDLFESTVSPDSTLKALMRRSRAYYSMMVYHLKAEIDHFREKKSGKY